MIDLAKSASDLIDEIGDHSVSGWCAMSEEEVAERLRWIAANAFAEGVFAERHKDYPGITRNPYRAPR